MHLGQDPESDDWAQQLLQIGVTDGDIVLMLLYNLDPLHGLCNGTWLRLLRATQRVLECCVLTENGDGNVVLIPRIALDIGPSDSAVPFRRFQFPVHLVYVIKD